MPILKFVSLFIVEKKVKYLNLQLLRLLDFNMNSVVIFNWRLEFILNIQFCLHSHYYCREKINLNLLHRILEFLNIVLTIKIKIFYRTIHTKEYRDVEKLLVL